MIALDSSLLTTSASKIVRTKCFPIELNCVNTKANTKYDFYMDGILCNAFVKPFGKNLGDPIVSDANGRISALFLMNVPYQDVYAVNKGVAASSYVKNKVLEFVSPDGVRSRSYLPILNKPTQ